MKGPTLQKLTNGPSSLMQALAIPPTYSGLKLEQTSLELIPPTMAITNIQTSQRIGIKKATEKPWRFYITP